ncbi:MAG: FixH family protein [Undibacterium sp.]|nr:FixH family protein [Undibacterium sp.]
MSNNLATSASDGLLTAMAKKDLWYKEPWLVLVVGGPLIVVCASLFTAYLAYSGADQIVAKDYYRQGLMINTNLQRDAQARELQLVATLQLDIAQKKMNMILTAAQRAQNSQKMPSEVQLSLASSGAGTGSINEIIHRVSLKLIPGSTANYQADLSQLGLALEGNAKTLLHVKLETNDWRLTGDWHQALENTLVLKGVR